VVHLILHFDPGTERVETKLAIANSLTQYLHLPARRTGNNVAEAGKGETAMVALSKSRTSSIPRHSVLIRARPDVDRRDFAPVPTGLRHWGVGWETTEYSKTPLGRFCGDAAGWTRGLGAELHTARRKMSAIHLNFVMSER